MPISKIKTSSILADAASTNLNIDAGTLFLDATNNRVGIGTTSPTTKLHVVNPTNTATSADNCALFVSSTNRTGYLQLDSEAINGNSSVVFSTAGTEVGRVLYNNLNNYMMFRTNGTIERMRIDSSGNVGIGTTTIGTKLVVADTGQSLVGTAYNVADFTNAGQTLGTRIGYDSSNGAVIASAGVDKPIAFWQYNTSNYVERMRITAAGLLAIGRTTAYDSNAVLTLEKSGVSASVINSTTNSVTLINVANGDSSTAYTGTASNHPFALFTNSAERMRIDSGGNLLVTGGYIPSNTSRLVVRGFSSGGYNTTFSQTNATVQIISNEMNNDAWNPTLNIAMIRQSLTTGKDSFGGIGFSTIDDSNNAGMHDAGRIAIVNETASAVASGTAMAFYTQVGSATQTNAAVERMRIDSLGRVTMPGQPSFKAGRSSAYSPGANTDIVFNDTSSAYTHFNNGGYYNTSNGRFTAPVAGRYFFSTLVIWEQMPNNTPMSDCLYIMQNGTFATYSFRRATHVSNSTSDGAFFTDHCHVILNLAANDYVTVQNSYAGRVVHGNTRYTWFAGHLLG